MKYKFKKIFLFFMLICAIIMLVLNPKVYIQQALNGAIVWATLLLPCLFPFFIFSKLFISLNLFEELSKLFKKPTEILFNAPSISGYVFFMSIISGYPVGAKLVSDLFKNNQITTNQAKSIINFTSNSGPMFIVGTVGIGMFFNKTCGLIILASHIIGAIINGIIHRGKTNNTKTLNMKYLTNISQKNIIADSIQSSIHSILTVGGYIIFCSVLIEMLSQIGIITLFTTCANQIFNIPQDISASVFESIFEITNGCFTLSKTALNISSKTVLASIFISFGGVSTILQSMGFLHDCGITYKIFIKQKITHAIISGGISYLLCLLLF